MNIRFHTENWPKWDSSPQPRAYRAHSLTTVIVIIYIYIYIIYIYIYVYIYRIQFEYSIPYRELAQVGFKPATSCLPCTQSNHCYCYYIYIYILYIDLFICIVYIPPPLPINPKAKGIEL